MPKYQFGVEIQKYVMVTIEAETEEEAQQEAFDNWDCYSLDEETEQTIGVENYGEVYD